MWGASQGCFWGEVGRRAREGDCRVFCSCLPNSTGLLPDHLVGLPGQRFLKCNVSLGNPVPRPVSGVERWGQESWSGLCLPRSRYLFTCSLTLGRLPSSTVPVPSLFRRLRRHYYCYGCRRDCTPEDSTVLARFVKRDTCGNKE